jgi:hypothetical protein
LLVSQRAKHKEQQLYCRQQAVTGMLLGVNSLNAVQEKPSIESSIIMPEVNTASSTSSTILPPVVQLSSTNHQLKTVTHHSYQITNTPPVKLAPSQPQPQSIVPTVPKFLASNVNMNKILLNNATNTQPAIFQPPSAPMSVTYGFMKNSSFGSNTIQPKMINPSIPSQPMPQATPKFLATNPSMMMMMMNHMNHQQQPLPPLSNQPTSHHQQIQLQHGINNAENDSNSDLLPPEDTCRVYSVESKFKTGGLESYTNHHTLQHPQITALRSSPPESVCSHMSDCSLPSVMRQDISKPTTNHQEFKALFNRINSNGAPVSTQPNVSHSNGAGLVPIVDMSRNVAPVRYNQYVQHHEEEQPKQFITEDSTCESNTNHKYRSNDMLLSGSSSSSSSSVSSQSSIIHNHNYPAESASFQPPNASHMIQPNMADTNSAQDDLDDDLEMFIRENFQPLASTTSSIRKSNSSLNEADTIDKFSKMKKSASSFKRASLHSLDSLTFSAATSSSSKSQLSSFRQSSAVTSSASTSQTKSSMSVNNMEKKHSQRLSSDNISNFNTSIRKNVTTTQKKTLPQASTKTSTSSTTTKTTTKPSLANTNTKIVSNNQLEASKLNKPPATNAATKQAAPITMTKTAQLRAAAATSTNNGTVKKPTTTSTSNSTRPVGSNSNPLAQKGMFSPLKSSANSETKWNSSNSSSFRRKSLNVGVGTTNYNNLASNNVVSSVTSNSAKPSSTAPSKKSATLASKASTTVTNSKTNVGQSSTANNTNKLKQPLK